MAISAGAATRTGQVRALNEDSVLALARIYAVADGMGGHAAGDRASQLAVEQLSVLGAAGELSTPDVLTAIGSANQAILDEGQAREDERGMGTTLSGLAVITMSGRDHWLGFNVGDSRLYCLEDDGLQQISVDHSEVQELIDGGLLTPEDAKRHPARNVVTRSLGTRPAPVVDQWLLPMTNGQTFLMCSDGLTLELTEARIEELLRTAGSPEEIAERLVAAADEAGGRDNVSAVVVQTSETDEPEHDERADTRPRLIEFPAELL